MISVYLLLRLLFNLFLYSLKLLIIKSSKLYSFIILSRFPWASINDLRIFKHSTTDKSFLMLFMQIEMLSNFISLAFKMSINLSTASFINSLEYSFFDLFRITFHRNSAHYILSSFKFFDSLS